jgi:hypothetical protein
LLGEDNEEPWLQIGAGLLLGGLTYLVGSALNPRDLAAGPTAE